MDFKLSALDVRAMEPADYVLTDTSVLKEFYRRATQCSVDLNGQITLDEGKGPIRGSRSLVYSGTLRQGVAENKVAVKVYSGLPANEDLLKRILAEIQLWSTLRHENIVRVLGVSTNFGLTISIISDWMGMGDAHAYVQNTQNDPRPLLMDIAAGLHYLHTHKLGPIIHCDLNGRNVLVSNDRRALLADFYSSVFMYPNSDMDPDPPRGGSFRWMAPELLDNYAPSPAGDVWAFGMVVLRILREVHIGSKLHHENIVRLLGVSTQFGVTISIISDWMELGDAHNYVQDIQNDPRPLLRDIATGLQYLHTHELGPICHGDLKGLNVLVSNDHRALLTDFGLSTLTKSTLSLSIDSPRGGTFAWMAPELLDEYNSSAASDVWAYGMTALVWESPIMPNPIKYESHLFYSGAVQPINTIPWA
ncbi:hypothetical protein ID866_5271 [Astraeus odoratus]|nr:hypothetical protein ID866_5271 [Astraeus odoratus]